MFIIPDISSKSFIKNCLSLTISVKTDNIGKNKTIASTVAPIHFQKTFLAIPMSAAILSS